jgi:uncharacterized membrane protein YedE/YeeE
MSMPQGARISPQPMFISLVLGLLFVTAVPGVGWFWGQLVETIVLCIGGAFLVYAMLAYILAVNARLNAIERALAERGRPKR